MAELSTQIRPVDLAAINDPAVRKALREYHDQIMLTLNRQQMEIEALLETLIDRHMTSLGEFRRLIQKVQMRTGSSERLHEVLAATFLTPASPPAARPASSQVG